MKYVYLIFNYILGIFFLLSGIILLLNNIIPAILLLTIAFLLLPPVRAFLYFKLNRTLSPTVRTLSVLLLLVIFSGVSSQYEDIKKQELAAQEEKARIEKIASERQKLAAYFDANSAQILADAKASLIANDYQNTILLTTKYIGLGNDQLVTIHNEAKAKLEQAQKAEQAEKLLAEVKMLPESDALKKKNIYQQLVNLFPNNANYQSSFKIYERKVLEIAEAQKIAKAEQLLAEVKTVPDSEVLKKKSIYQQLVTLFPKNADYQSTLRSYERKISEMEEAQRVAEARKIQIEKLFSRWDGSLRSLETLIKNAMNDPDSYQHVETKYVDNGDHLIVIATFRGKNKFGAVVKNSATAKVSLTGEVLEIIQ
ncbi:MAG: hypothetical protein RIS84_1388 [Pseudomonadota bacterium]|jgi:uncharacterized membrane protein (DUF106 family)